MSLATLNSLAKEIFVRSGIYTKSAPKTGEYFPEKGVQTYKRVRAAEEGRMSESAIFRLELG